MTEAVEVLRIADRFSAINVLLGYGPRQIFTPLEATSA
jgi:hypothetical protein